MRTSVFAVTAVAFSLFSVAAYADTTYTYTGHDFNEVEYPYTTSDSLTGSFTVAGPALNLYGSFVPLSFSFSDGVQTLTQLNTTSATFSGGGFGLSQYQED